MKQTNVIELVDNVLLKKKKVVDNVSLINRDATHRSWTVSNPLFFFLLITVVGSSKSYLRTDSPRLFFGST